MCFLILTNIFVICQSMFGKMSPWWRNQMTKKYWNIKIMIETFYVVIDTCDTTIPCKYTEKEVLARFSSLWSSRRCFLSGTNNYHFGSTPETKGIITRYYLSYITTWWQIAYFFDVFGRYTSLSFHIRNTSVVHRHINRSARTCNHFTNANTTMRTLRGKTSH